MRILLQPVAEASKSALNNNAVNLVNNRFVFFITRALYHKISSNAVSVVTLFGKIRLALPDGAGLPRFADKSRLSAFPHRRFIC